VYLYFAAAVGFACLNEPESHTDGNVHCMLQVGPPILDRSVAVGQTKRHTLVLQVGGWGMRLTTSFLSKTSIVRKPWITASELSEESQGCYQGDQGSQRAVAPGKKIVTCIPTARQQFAKHIPWEGMHVREKSPLPCNGPVNAPL
jgi:hypothetical protein